jgi:HicA toxin of bacterial toxin-antitoxin,
MASLPVVSGSEAIRAFERAGWQRARQKGSHVSLVKSGVNVNLFCLDSVAATFRSACARLKAASKRPGSSFYFMDNTLACSARKKITSSRLAMGSKLGP